MSPFPQSVRATLALVVISAAAVADETNADADFSQEVAQLVTDLGADREATRDAARERLLELAGPTAAAGERMLAELPEPIEPMPAAVRGALASLRRTIADRLAKLTVTASRVTLDVVEAPIAEVLASIEEQTGNRVLDLRKQFGQQAADRPVTIQVDDAPFWEAVDQVLDEAGLGVYAYSGEPALGLVAREPGATPRWAAAAYAGPLRIEAARVTATRDLRKTLGESLNLQLEISWEPRLSPIAFSQPLGDVVVENEDGARLSLAQPERSIDLEAQAGGQAIEMTLPMLLPERETSLISTLRGTLQAVAPGRRAEFRFDKLTEVESPVVQQQGGATVTLQRLRKTNEIWELHMRLELDDAGDALASHRGWVFNNPAYLVGTDGEPIEHAGFETTMQQGNKIGLAYLFDLPDGLEGLTWVYQTPTAIVRFPVEYELSHIPLP